MAARSIVVRFVLAAVLAASIPASVSANGAPLAVPGLPTGVAQVGDGTLFVSLSGPFGVGGSVVAYRRAGAGYRLAGSVAVAAGASAVAATPDGRTVVVATRVGVAAVDATALVDGSAPVRVNAVRDGDAPHTNRIVLSVDGMYAFYTNQGDATLGVARIERDRQDGSPRPRIVAHVKLDRLPGGIALSHDGRTLYVTSEIDNVDPLRVAGAGDVRLGRERCASNLGPHGVLSVVDTKLAVDDPAHAVVARVAAGCAPVRVALSPSEEVAWVTVQGENRVVAFDTAALRTDPEHALRADVAVGDVPVGLAVSLDGRMLLVANSHRGRDPDEAREADLSIVDVRAALSGSRSLPATLTTGALAREVVSTADGSFLVTDYRGRSIDIVTKERIAAGSR